MATYEETLKSLFSLKAIRHSTQDQEFKHILEQLGNPHLAYKVIHITGTSGKGTVSLKTAATLIKNGHKTGLVISPHILSFRERISVNFEQIPEAYVVEKYSFLIQLFEKNQYPYAFEHIVCLLGFLYLRDCQVEYAVIEVGCGGKRDASNVVDPVISVITSVGLDHMHLLGNTIDEIATEKSGVIKPGKPVVIGPNTPQILLRQIADEKGSEVLVVETNQEFKNYIEENSKITQRIFEIVKVSPEALEFGLGFSQPFRLQKIEAFGKTFILDVGHNPMALNRVLSDFIREFGNEIRVVLAMSKGKSPKEFLDIIGKYSRLIHVVSSDHIRIVHYSVLQEAACEIGLELGISGEVYDVLQAISQVKTDEPVLVIGTCFIIETWVEAFRLMGVEIGFSLI
ncbi:hypothetical protein SteCoe_29404 [Stentor coeruleus]|uniref:Mur ligase central domain-containing protein n=1 Tax=Stentor coeruleus TaxID=5963 RepID=A0A1R2B606_9CILI|nr:hypothetical protein SteCoe_29404 [Stentor coeruleus]